MWRSSGLRQAQLLMVARGHPWHAAARLGESPTDMSSNGNLRIIVTDSSNLRLLLNQSSPSSYNRTFAFGFRSPLPNSLRDGQPGESPSPWFEHSRPCTNESKQPLGRSVLLNCSLDSLDSLRYMPNEKSLVLTGTAYTQNLTQSTGFLTRLASFS